MRSAKFLVEKLFRVFKNKYWFAIIAFASWMLFFDQHNVISQMKLAFELDELKDKSAYYEEMTRQTKIEHQALMATDASIEEFARENYWMKRENEDLFIIVDK